MTRSALAVLTLAVSSAVAVRAQPPAASQSILRFPTEAQLQAPDAPAEPALEPAPSEPPVFGAPIELYDPSGRALAPFYDALRRAEAGDQARVVFYGASHVASDLFTHVVRTGLQERFGDAGHGFILPARPWRHYRHQAIEVESSRHWNSVRINASSRDVARVGLAGVAVETDHAGAWGRIDTGAQTASRFEIHYLRQPDGGSFDVYLDGRRVRRVATGADAPEVSYAIVTAPDARHVLEVRARGNGPVRLFGVSVERESAGIIVDTLGINGSRASSQLLWDEAVQTEELRHVSPALVVLAYGTNESGDDDQPIEQYEARLRTVVARVRGTTPQAACMLIGPSDRPLRQADGTFVDRPRTAQVVETQRRVSRDFGCAFFDLVAFGGGPLSMVQWAASDPPFAQPDHVHFTARGYQRLGELLLSAMMSGFDAPPPPVPSAPLAAAP